MRQTAFQPAVDGTQAAATETVASEDIRSLLGDSGWLTVDVGELSDEDDLYAAGLTSHGSVNLMLALEERFDIEFPEHLLRRRTFESITAIRDAVSGILSGTSVP
ncbi:acyl carrier protein [Azospirillum soli]|uniref:acyl carrier protein n=1 Tax=Azospirillum soli TaxID=1304799 RepID=UPI001AE1FE9E|nr:acyl carrier protein [Azospirillum soli]MBP2315665.1 acyl carrier protein [Azospirillum soli]